MTAAGIVLLVTLITAAALILLVVLYDAGWHAGHRTGCKDTRRNYDRYNLW